MENQENNKETEIKLQNDNGVNIKLNIDINNNSLSEEKKELSPKKDITNSPLEKEGAYEKIEKLRKTFLQEYNKQSKIAVIILIAFVIIMFGGIALLITMPDKIHYVLIAMFVIFLGSFILSKSLKKTRETKIKQYVELYRKIINDEIIQDIELTDINQYAYEEFDPDKFKNIGIFSNLKEVRSNDLIAAKFDNKEFNSFNGAVFDANNNLLFYGKVLTLKLDSSLTGKIVFFKNTPEGKGPDVNGLIETDFINVNDFKAFTSASRDNLSALISEESKSVLAKFSLNEYIKDLTFVFEENRIFLLVSTRNDIVDVAVKEPFDQEILNQLRNIINIFFEFVKRLK